MLFDGLDLLGHIGSRFLAADVRHIGVNAVKLAPHVENTVFGQSQPQYRVGLGIAPVHRLPHLPARRDRERVDNTRAFVPHLRKERPDVDVPIAVKPCLLARRVFERLKRLDVVRVGGHENRVLSELRMDVDALAAGLAPYLPGLAFTYLKALLYPGVPLTVRVGCSPDEVRDAGNR